MKRFYSYLLLLSLMFSGSLQSVAQSTSGRVYVGYAKYDDQIWEYDGLSLQFDSKVGCAIRLTKDMIEPYVGGTIIGMRVGWDTSTQTGTYEGFVRTDFNSENLTTGRTTVKYNYSDSNPGWNNMTLTEYVIPEGLDQLIVGFTTRLKKNVCAIPTLYPHDTPNSCFLWVEGDNDEEGNPHWIDMKDRGILPILLIIKDTEGTFNYLPVINLLTDNGIQQTETADDVIMRVKNMGSQKINNIEVTSRQGEQTWSKTIPLSIATGVTSKIFLAPIYCFHSGDVELSITKVNNKEVTNPKTYTVNIIGVPEDVANQYTHRPLVEYYESENNYRSARYYDEYVNEPVSRKANSITFVCQHLDDQFMTGDDDATVLSLQLCDNDSSKVSIPAMCVDRAIATENISYQMNSSTTPMFDVFINASDAINVFNAAAKRPTFVSLDVEGTLAEDKETLDVLVNSDVAPGIMPEGEKLRLTVYLMEDDVESDSQLFWNEKEKDEYQGMYTHPNVIREVLTAPEGDPIAAGGSIQTTYQTELDPTWNVDNMYIVAFIHRDGKLGGKRMHVFNSAKGNIVNATGIREIKNEELRMMNGIYDLQGRQIKTEAKSSLKKGIYIIGGKKIVRK
ncbi:MAG: Omp28-related outer membrane protein [Bacteroidaceae bacterium]|nr:Omp28-related outer membrane protein [Bacteroidaceae bacterium]